MKQLIGRTLARGLLVGVVVSAVALPGNGLLAQEEHRVSGNEVSVYNLAGHVDIVPGSGGDVVVRVMRGGGDADRLEVGIQEVRGRQALVIRYPGDEVIYPEMGRQSRTQVRIQDDGTFGDEGEGRGSQVDIRGSGSGLEAWADLRISVPSGKDLAVYQAVGEAEVGAVDGDLLVDTGSGAVSAEGGSGSLNIDTGSGSVSVREFRGDLLVDTGSGGVEFSDVQGQEVNVDTGSGSVEGSGVSASYFKVDTGSGRIRFSQISATDVHMVTGSGSVELELLEDVDQLMIDTGSGGVTLRIPSNFGAEIEVDTGSGGIDMDMPIEVRQVRRNFLRGVLGDGRGTVRIDTGSGGVRLIGG